MLMIHSLFHNLCQTKRMKSIVELASWNANDSLKSIEEKINEVNISKNSWNDNV